MVRASTITPYRPYIYAPDGWDAAWRAAKAASGSTRANFLFLGDSITWGSNSSDFLNKSWASLVQASLTTQYGLAAEFLPHYSYCTGLQAPIGAMPWTSISGSASVTPVTVMGYGRAQFVNTSTTQTFTSRRACTALDFLYVDHAAGTFTYSLDGAAAVTVTTIGPAVAGGGVVKRIRFTGLSSATHTLAIAAASANNVLCPMGIVEYPNGVSGTGIGFARCGYSGVQANHWAAAEPTTATDLWRGKMPQGDLIPAPTTAPSVAVGAGGSVDVGTHYYAVTIYNSNATILTESLIGVASSAVANTTGNQSNTLTAIPTRSGGAASNHRRIYRTKAGAPSTGPYFLLTEINNNTDTTLITANNTASLNGADTVADASLSATQPPASYTVANTGFDFPTQPHLAIIELGVNDANNSITTANFQQQIVNIIRSIHRGQNPQPSILFYIASYPDGVSSDVANTSFATGAATWHQFKVAARDIAINYGCAVMDIDAKWGELGSTLGFQTTDVHPTDAGHQDIATTLLSIL